LGATRLPSYPVGKMELITKILTYSAVIGVLFVALTLRVWAFGGREDSFKKDIRDCMITVIVFAAIAAVIIYINN